MAAVPDVVQSARFRSEEERRRRRQTVAENSRRQVQFVRVQLTGKLEGLVGESMERVAREVGEAFGATVAKDAWVSESSGRFAGARVYVDVAATAVRRRASAELESGRVQIRDEWVEWRAADPRDGPPLGRGEWSFDYEWFLEMSPLGGEEGQKDEAARQRAAVANLRRLLREYGFAATLEQPLGGSRPGGFLRAVGGVEELRGIADVVSRFATELRGTVGLGEAALGEGEGTILRCYQVQFLELGTVRTAVAGLVKGVSLLGGAHGHTERGRAFIAVKLAGEPELVLDCMRRMFGLSLRQGDRTFDQMRWSPLPQDGSPVGVALSQARALAGTRAALGFGQGSASMFPVADWAWRSAGKLLRGEEGGEGGAEATEGAAGAGGWAQWQGTPATLHHE